MLDAKDGEELFTKLVDGTGRTIRQQIVFVRNQQAELSLERMPTGVYAVIVVNDKGEQFKTKLIISQ